MKGIILAGGTGSRLLPVTRVTNKHLLPIGHLPMIDYPINKLIASGIKDILVVTGTEHAGAIFSYLGSGKDRGCCFTYRVQDQAGGIAEALGLAKDFSQGDKICVILGDNIFQDELLMYAVRFNKQKLGAMVLLKDVPDPERFGVAELLNGKIINIEEKPINPKSNFAVTGIYFYDNNVFDIISTLKPSARGELEISSVNNAYIQAGMLEYDIFSGYWTDAGTHESLARASKLVL